MCDRIPDSISALSKSVMWTVCMWVSAFVVLWFMCRVGEPLVAFCACTCLVMVGVLPLKEGSKNIAHYVFAVGAALISQLWCGIVGDWFWLVMWWCLYLALLPMYRKKWCFVAEVWCVGSVVVNITQH